VKPLNWVHLLYNQADSFTPGSLAYNVYGVPLPDPKGKTKDYGIQLVLFGGSLNIRAEQYETLDIGRADSTINTYVARTLRLDYSSSITDPNLGGQLTAQLQTLNPSWSTDQVLAEVMRLSGIDPNFITGHYSKTHGDTGNASSRGKEIEIEYNPNKFWTVKSTITQAKAFNAQMSGQLQDYIAARMPTWTTVRNPIVANAANPDDPLNFWWTTPINGTTPKSWYTGNVQAPVALAVATQGKQRMQTREWRVNVVTNYKLAGIAQNSWLKSLDVGGAVRWEGRACLGFYGAAPDPDGIVRNYDPNRPYWDRPRYYFDLSAGYNLRLCHDKVRCRLQLNVRDVFEGGRLQTVGINPDGRAYAFRIVDPRQFVLGATFDL
jgi:hypothetical protein